MSLGLWWSTYPLELYRGAVLVAGVPVRVVLAGQAPVGGRDVGHRGRAREFQFSIVVEFRQRRRHLVCCLLGVLDPSCVLGGRSTWVPARQRWASSPDKLTQPYRQPLRFPENKMLGRSSHARQDCDEQTELTETVRLRAALFFSFDSTTAHRRSVPAQGQPCPMLHFLDAALSSFKGPYQGDNESLSRWQQCGPVGILYVGVRMPACTCLCLRGGMGTDRMDGRPADAAREGAARERDVSSGSVSGMWY
jgi:hypothetical protein